MRAPNNEAQSDIVLSSVPSLQLNPRQRLRLQLLANIGSSEQYRGITQNRVCGFVRSQAATMLQNANVTNEDERDLLDSIAGESNQTITNWLVKLEHMGRRSL